MNLTEQRKKVLKELEGNINLEELNLKKLLPISVSREINKRTTFSIETFGELLIIFFEMYTITESLNEDLKKEKSLNVTLQNKIAEAEQLFKEGEVLTLIETVRASGYDVNISFTMSGQK